MKNIKTFESFLNEKFDFKNPFGKTLGQFYKYLIDNNAKRDVELKLKNGNEVYFDQTWFTSAALDQGVPLHQLHKLKGTELEVSERGSKMIINLSDISKIVYI